MKKLIILSLNVLLSWTFQPVNGQINMEPSQLHMYVFDVGDINVFDISNWSPGIDVGKSAKFACPAFLIRHPNGDLMWDTGLSDFLADSPNGRTNSLFTAKLYRTLSDQLMEINVNPMDVEYLAISHLHSDHIGNANLFRNATLIVQEEEYEAMFERDEVLSLVDSLKTNKAIKLSGDYDVFGDGSVIIKRAIGHTPGHQVIFVDLPEAGPIVLSGDLYHFAKNRELMKVPSFNFDKELTLKSMKEIEAFIESKNATLLIQHDIIQKEEILHSPNIIR